MFTPPAHVHIEYRQNVHKLTDAAKTIDERAATFDGALHNSNLHSLDDCIHKKMKGRLRKWMVPVMQHVSALLPHSCCVSLLELFVKVDTAGRIWLLHAGAVKTHLYNAPSPRRCARCSSGVALLTPSLIVRSACG